MCFLLQVLRKNIVNAIFRMRLYVCVRCQQLFVYNVFSDSVCLQWLFFSVYYKGIPKPVFDEYRTAIDENELIVRVTKNTRTVCQLSTDPNAEIPICPEGQGCIELGKCPKPNQLTRFNYPNQYSMTVEDAGNDVGYYSNLKKNNSLFHFLNRWWCVCQRKTENTLTAVAYQLFEAILSIRQDLKQVSSCHNVQMSIRYTDQSYQIHGICAWNVRQTGQLRFLEILRCVLMASRYLYSFKIYK